jgi:hypothetical protein
VRASLTYMTGPTIPQDVFYEVTTDEAADYNEALRLAGHELAHEPPPHNTMEVRIVIGNTVTQQEPFRRGGVKWQR